MKGFIMQKINLRKYYPEHYTKDTFIEVSDKIADALEDERKKRRAYAEYIRYHKAFYSLDADSSLAFDASHPQKLYEQKELTEALDKAMDNLSEIQHRRLYAYYILGLSQQVIAETEHVSKSSVSESISQGLANLRKNMKSE